MGNDGGSIPTRRELVKEAAKALTTTQVKEVQNEQQEYAWSHDPLTRKPLSRPVVSDAAGVLYNKDSIIEFLLAEDGAAKAEQEKMLEGRVKSLKDVVEVKFEIDSGEEAQAQTANGGSGRKERWVCPITGRELGPGSKGVYLVPCGHAFAGSVVKEVSGETCLQCNEAYAENDIIPILPITPTDIARLSLRTKTLKEKGLTHALKKAPGSKKRKKNAEKEANGVDANGEGVKSKDPSSGEEKKSDKKEKAKSVEVPKNGIKNASTASLTRKVLEEQEQKNKKRKLEQNDNVKSLFSSRDAKPKAGNSADYMTRGFTIGGR
ncbi:DUF602-domain-containing protein [Aaosphaeria arxii CBS 175.79]|uniref:DUF602-domain-containing protein n=1 Tax=Aaosphaeria arxii CBS 175.79 TaxID=1450172 RepID=A0A6A5XTR8_9PLEO|nr:DUF602-domain-containing protein [Aaosphaeria arxii CBS 175.79]KAF2016306.1 DUF602-domain-containing protein [Aaosphaeria arxii CBS 175.79]